MAKQSGIHQLRGKVGEHSYYRQTGVQSGIVRAINQGMSSKVKTDEAFANTRLNNAEFGQAGRIASVLARFIVPKFRPMVLPFSQSRMAKVLLEDIKQADGNWGERNIEDPNGDMLSEALNIVSKNPINEIIESLVADITNGVVNITLANGFASKLSAIGADGADIRLVAASPWIGTFSTSERRYSPSYARGNDYIIDVDESATSVTFEDVAFRPAPPVGWPAVESRFFVVIFLPFRTINGREYTLQEHCTFGAFPVDSQS